MLRGAWQAIATLSADNVPPMSQRATKRAALTAELAALQADIDRLVSTLEGAQRRAASTRAGSRKPSLSPADQQAFSDRI